MASTSILSSAKKAPKKGVNFSLMVSLPVIEGYILFI
jgi:hypothetical protein